MRIDNITEICKSPTGYSNLCDKNGVQIRVGDDGRYDDMHFHVIRKGKGFFLEKWCKIYDLPLNKESAKRYEITERNNES